jgi:integrase
MAKIIPIKNRDGSMSYGVHVNVKPFKRTWQSFETKAAATQWRDKLTAELRKQRVAGAVRPNLGTLTLAALNREYLADPETRALGSVKDRELHLKWWTLKYGTVKALDFGVLQLREARDRLIPGREPGTVVRYLASQRSAWNWGRATALIPNDRVWPPRLMLTEPPARVRYLSDEELTAVLKAAKEHSTMMYAAVTVALATGARQGEMLRLTWADVDLGRSTIRLLKTKNGSARSVHLMSIAVDALKAVKSGPVVGSKQVFLHADGEWLSGRRLDWGWRTVRKAAGLSDFRWHDFRHSCASFLAQNGATLLEIGSVLGHKSAQVTLKYAHLVDGKAVTGHAAMNKKLLGAT